MTSTPPNPFAPPAAPTDDDVSPGLQALQARVAGVLLCVALGIALYNTFRGHDLSEDSFGRLLGMLIAFAAILGPTISFLRGGRRGRFWVIGLLAVAALASLAKLPHVSRISLLVTGRGLAILGAVVVLVTGAPSRRRLIIGAVLGGAFVISQVLVLLGAVRLFS